MESSNDYVVSSEQLADPMHRENDTSKYTVFKMNGNHVNGKFSDSETDENDDEQVPLIPSLAVTDDEYLHKTFEGLNVLRKNDQFCDVVLQVGSHEIIAHRCVLACASPYLFDLFEADYRHRSSDEKSVTYKLSGLFDRESLETVIQYAYTGRLDVPLSQVKSVYMAASRLKMDRVVKHCADFLGDHLDVTTAIDIRSMPGIAKHKELVEKVDTLLQSEIATIVSSKSLVSLPVVRVEVLAANKEEITARENAPFPLSTLVLDWIQKEYKDADASLDTLTGKTHMLYLSSDNALHDCVDIEKGDVQDSDIIQDYKQESKRHLKPGSKSRKSSSVQPSRPRAMLFSRSISDQMPATESTTSEWCVIAAHAICERSILGLVVIEGKLATLSVVQRLNSCGGTHPADCGRVSVNPTPLTTPGQSRSPSQEKQFEYSKIPPMSTARCTVGCVYYNNLLVVCGGYNRGECLKTVEAYDHLLNTWSPIPSMSEARGRLDVAVIAGRIYAVGGCNGAKELATMETFALNGSKWESAPPLRVARSNIGVCDLDGKLFCVGGWNGQSAVKYCDVFNPAQKEWKSAAPLNVGRYQAGVTSCRNRVIAVGGCDAWNCLNSVEIYDPEKNVWEFLPPLITARRGCGLAYYNDKLWVIGGSDGQQTLCSTEVFDFETRTWGPGPNMTSCRANIGVAVINGKLFAVGGFSGKHFLDTLEYLDPEAQEWTTYIHGGALSDRRRSESPSDVSRRPSASSALMSHDEFSKLKNESCKLDDVQECLTSEYSGCDSDVSA